jgi:NAD(P)-dependent dehydrogenase (short-subunit alcohol dehydrogenase family)
MNRKELVVITGGNQGLGLATAVALTTRYDIVVSARSRDKGESAVADIAKVAGSNTVHWMELDNAHLDSAHRFAVSLHERFGDRALIFVCNAGIMATPYRLTADGFEEQFQVNHLAHFVIVRQLMKGGAHLKRVVCLSSKAHMRVQGLDLSTVRSEVAQDGWLCYGRSKLCNIFFAMELARRGVEAVSLHPGLVVTQLTERVGMTGGIPLSEGILTPVHCITEPIVSGEYYYKQRVESVERTAASKSVQEAERLWQFSEEAAAKWIA